MLAIVTVTVLVSLVVSLALTFGTEIRRGLTLAVLHTLYAVDCLCGRRDDAVRDRLLAKIRRAWRIQDVRNEW